MKGHGSNTCHTPPQIQRYFNMRTNWSCQTIAKGTGTRKSESRGSKPSADPRQRWGPHYLKAQQSIGRFRPPSTLEIQQPATVGGSNSQELLSLEAPILGCQTHQPNSEVEHPNNMRPSRGLPAWRVGKTQWWHRPHHRSLPRNLTPRTQVDGDITNGAGESQPNKVGCNQFTAPTHVCMYTIYLSRSNLKGFDLISSHLVWCYIQSYGKKHIQLWLYRCIVYT